MDSLGMKGKPENPRDFEGQEVIMKIVAVQTDPSDRPLEEVKIIKASLI